MRGEKNSFLDEQVSSTQRLHAIYLFPDIMLVGFSPFNWETIKDILRGFGEGFEVS
jgi:hypothetical protein